MLEVSKLINNVGATAAPFLIPNQDECTKDDLKRLVRDLNKWLNKTFNDNNFY